MRDSTASTFFREANGYRERTGSSTDDVRGTFAIMDALPQGAVLEGPWQLEISDHANIDTGTLNSWSLDVWR